MLAAEKPLSAIYAVEVSGWDHTHSFFVEKSELCWSEETGKQVTLSRQLSGGEMIFVRLLQPTDGERAFPIAYEAEPLPGMSNGQRQFRLRRAMPRSVGLE